MEDSTYQRLVQAWQKAERDMRRAERDRAALQRALSLIGVSVGELQTTDSEIDESRDSLPIMRESESSPLEENLTPPAQNSQTGDGHAKIRITQEIRNAVAEFEGEFTQQDVLKRIIEWHPAVKVRAATISSALWRMASKGEIEKVRDGYGSEPNTYRRASITSLQEGFPDNEGKSEEEDTAIEREAMS